jgi:hypothetical protein
MDSKTEVKPCEHDNTLTMYPNGTETGFITCTLCGAEIGHELNPRMKDYDEDTSADPVTTPSVTAATLLADLISCFENTCELHDCACGTQSTAMLKAKAFLKRGV